jgi:hypothetical protein
VDDYTVLVSAGWTNASPVLPPPSTWQAHAGSLGLVPAFLRPKDRGTRRLRGGGGSSRPGEGGHAGC